MAPKPEKYRPGFKPLSVARCLLALAPFIALYLITRDPETLSVAILAGGLFVAGEKLTVGPRLMALQYILAAAAFVVLFATIGLPIVFTLLVALMAMAVVAATRNSARLRSLGNWIFIPAVYLACELGENRDEAARLALLPSVLTYSLLAPVSVGLMRMVWPRADENKKPNHLAEAHAPSSDPNPDWLRQSLAAFAAVLLVTGFAEIFQIPNRQWMIWSALSVIALDLTSSRKKIQDRFFGVLVGCPLGLLAGLAIPSSEVAYSLAILLILISLVAFEDYRTAFTSRCALTAFAAAMMGGSILVAGERVMNVILGGCAGVLALYVALHRQKGKAGKQPVS